MISNKQIMRILVDRAIEETPILDMHTHIYTPCFGDLLLYGVDELITYHYLIAETFRYTGMPYDRYWAMSKKEQADFIYQTLFIDHTPVSESCRGVLTVLHKLGAPVGGSLDGIRDYLKRFSREEFVDKVFELSHVDRAVMTNDPFDEQEYAVWQSGYVADRRFIPALRLDGLLVYFEKNVDTLVRRGYRVSRALDETTFAELRRFLEDEIGRMGAVYMAVSLPDSFVYPDDSVATRIIDECVLPVAARLNIPFALMIGVKRQVNPGLRLAGDAVGKTAIESIERLCAGNPRTKFLATLLSRENQHELCVMARKFRNLLIFGCWWFLNNPSIIDEMTRMRLELLGTSMVPQHSDARVLDQLIYKWAHSRSIIAAVLKDKYANLMDAGWPLREEEIHRDVGLLLGGAFEAFLKLRFEE